MKNQQQPFCPETQSETHFDELFFELTDEKLKDMEGGYRSNLRATIERLLVGLAL
tara:strand:+ start:568 stop:732 length:165 start_codon:yes stop_codon:yes gene_type:complete